MNALAQVPQWAAWLAAALVLAGALVTFIGCVGLLRLGNFYERVHAPTLGTTLGMFLVVAGTIVYFSLQQGEPVLHLIVLGGAVSITTPVGLMLLARAALARDRLEEQAGVTPSPRRRIGLPRDDAPH